MPISSCEPVPSNIAQKRLSDLLAKAAQRAAGGNASITQIPDSESSSSEDERKITFKHDKKRVFETSTEEKSSAVKRTKRAKSKSSTSEKDSSDDSDTPAKKKTSDKATVERVQKSKSSSSSSESSEDSDHGKQKDKKRSTEKKVVKFKEGSDDESMPSDIEEQQNSDEESEEQQDSSKKDDGKDSDYFQTIGFDFKKRKIAVPASAPHWVKKAVKLSTTVEPCGVLDEDVDLLDKSLVKALKQNGITGLYPVQKQVIRALLDARVLRQDCPPRDICVAAPTGSGKTLAFVLPLVKLLKRNFERAVRAVILLPTSELAKQVHDVFKTYAEPHGIVAVLLTGLKNRSEEAKLLVDRGRSLCDVVIATPAKLLEHLRSTPDFSLKLLELLVLDEADRMVEMIQQGLIHEIEDAVFSKSPTSQACRCSDYVSDSRSRPTALSCCALRAHHIPLRKLLYSATLLADAEKLQYLNLYYPLVFHARLGSAPANMKKIFTLPKSLQERKVFCDISVRPLLLWYWLSQKEMGRMLIFARTREECHRLRVVIEQLGDVRVVDLSAELKKRKRQKALTDFDNGAYDVLVCTSVLARGMDLSNVENVVLYHVPTTTEEYVHMVGRTARANKPGCSIVLLNQAENAKLSKLVRPISNSKLNKLDWDQQKLSEFHERYQQALDTAKQQSRQNEKKF